MRSSVTSTVVLVGLTAGLAAIYGGCTVSDDPGGGMPTFPSSGSGGTSVLPGAGNSSGGTANTAGATGMTAGTATGGSAPTAGSTAGGSTTGGTAPTAGASGPVLAAVAAAARSPRCGSRTAAARRSPVSPARR